MDAPDSGELWCEIGSFEPAEARRLMSLLDQQSIPFQLEGDHSRLQQPFRFLQLEFGLYPEGSKVLVFVPEKNEVPARQLVAGMFPV